MQSLQFTDPTSILDLAGKEGGLLDLGGLRGLFILCGGNVIDGDVLSAHVHPFIFVL